MRGSLLARDWPLAAALCAVALGAGDPLDLRVSKAMGQRGYNKVRISVVGDGSEPLGHFFDYDYNAPFVHRWTNLQLHSAIKDVADGGTTFTIAGRQVTVKLPRQGARARGLFLADPCISSRDLGCANLLQFKVFERLVEVINSVVGSAEIDFWGVIGDNFYEQRSPIARQLFQALSLEAKSKLFLAVPGNHDFWILGTPPSAVPQDQFGNGFMQYYGQDTEAALLGPAPFDFSANPANKQIATMHNFVFSHQIGDIAFFGFSGAHHHDELQPYAQRFCQWLTHAPTVNTAVILGHWNTENLGCTAGMSAPDVYKALKTQPGCIEKTLLYVDGHDHCNAVTEPDHGFMIGANGMGGCNQFGFLIMESDPDAYMGPNVRVDYFELASMNESYQSDNFGVIHACLAQSGYTACRDAYATKWRAVPTPPIIEAAADVPRLGASRHGPKGLSPAAALAAVAVSAVLGVAAVAALVRRRACASRPEDWAERLATDEAAPE